MLANTVRLFPLFAILLSLVAYFVPNLFVDLKSQIVPLLMIIMLSMGLTLSIDDFKKLKIYKRAILVGILLQFTIMPFVALFIANFLNLEKSFVIGMILVGSVAGGTASNVICYIAKGNIALSIIMTTLSTLIGVIITPILIKNLAGTMIDISIVAMVISLLKIVLLPVVIGILLNHFLSKIIKIINPILPIISIIAIVLVIAIVVALNKNMLSTLGFILPLAVVIHNITGLVAGFWFCKILGFDKKTCKTISIEVGLQNSGLAVALANQFFTPTTALPGAIFSIWHNISGSLLAGYWSKTK
ncbi:MAG: bile acid:sodium symporter family protein [Sulfurospirillum sp.]|nr:bile acid:sodium symporter family protein [Sulfurospirillum sp.]MBL0703846.1 bile acid:sodium symporter family protein [Sulfurospirillum sp.]